MGTGEIEIRNFRLADSDDLWAMLLAAFEDGELRGTTRSAVEGWHARLPAEPSDTLVATLDGNVAGLITPRRSQMVVGRDFRRQGIGRRLVEVAEGFLRARGVGPLYLWLPHENEGALAFYGELEFRYHHSLWNMRLRDDADVPPPSFPPAVVSRRYRYEDDVAFVELVNTAFLDHPTPMSVTIDRVRFRHSLPEFDPDDLCLLAPADAPERLIGFCRVEREDHDGRPIGDVAVLGVRPEWRRLGLGRELLRWGIHRARAIGAAEVFLVVEGENDRALRLYEGTGFERIEEWPRYSRTDA